MRAICLISGDHEAQLDHLASLASLLDLPLFVTDPNIFQKAKFFYPFTESLFVEESSLLSFLITCDFVFVSCKHYSSELAATLKFFYHTTPRFCYCPHGNSDKGWASARDLLQNQDLSLIYGKSMLKMLKKKGVLDSLKGTFVTGNYRLIYYKKHQDFYDNLAKHYIFSKLLQDRKTLLYAPTWKDAENNSSFFDLAPLIIKNLPKNLNLVIKLHPSLERDDSFAVHNFRIECQKNSQIHIIHDFPPIYPILQHIDALFSDISSIGYDYLYFNRPLYLTLGRTMETKLMKKIKLATCSQLIDTQQVSKILSDLEKNLAYSQQAFEKKRGELYAATFDKSLTKETFSQDLLKFIGKITHEF